MPELRQKLTNVLAHWKNCKDMRALLARYPSRNLSRLYWYDLKVADAASVVGFFRVAWAYLTGRAQDATAAYYGAGTMYWAKPHSDGYVAPAPTVWTCQGLDTKPYFDADPWCQRLEAAPSGVRDDYLGVQDRRKPNPASAQDVDSGQWDNIFLTTTKGEVNPEFRDDCHFTLNLLHGFPLCTNFGFAVSSISAPGTHIKAHTGGSNLRLRYHLGIDVPEPDQNRMRVAHEVRNWQQGKVFAFDDGYDHEVWNTGTKHRALLIVDLWHPSLSEADITCLSDPLFNRFGKVSA